jgi:flagellar biosynthetic protein FliP
MIKKFYSRPAFWVSLCITLVIGCIITLQPAWAQSISLNLGGAEDAPGSGSMTGRVVQIVALLTVLSLAPGILMMMTSFTRIVIVFSFLRSAIGIQQTPPNQVLISLAMFLTFFIMMPTFQTAYRDGIQPLMSGEMDEMQAMGKSIAPFKTFMLKHTREKDLMLFAEANKTVDGQNKTIENPNDIPMQVVIPAFMISEIRRAFEIGFLLFLPFLIIDMVVAAILMSMGMMMLPPSMISLPFKIIFFVLVDGWYLITGSLIQSYGMGATG